jgi:3-oxoacyl-[acyl-carrier protein] reductase
VARAPSTIITGCASGIGLALCDRLYGDGHRVVATDINEEGLRQAAAERGWEPERARLVRLDLRDKEAVQRVVDETVEHNGSVDVLLNVAGHLHPGYAHEAPLEEVDRHIDVNVKGTLYLTMAAARRMVPQGSGHIVNVASLAGVAGIPGLSLYSSSKFAVRGWSLAVAAELHRHGVYVTVVCPDAVQTPMLDKQVDFKEAALTFSGARALTTDEVVSAIVDEVLVKRPLEVMLPRARGALAKLASAAPRMHHLVQPLLHRKGRSAQRRASSEG